MYFITWWFISISTSYTSYIIVLCVSLATETYTNYNSLQCIPSNTVILSTNLVEYSIVVVRFGNTAFNKVIGVFYKPLKQFKLKMFVNFNLA